MTDLFGAQLERIAPYFPMSHGVPRLDDHRVVSGIVFVIRRGIAGAMPQKSTGFRYAPTEESSPATKTTQRELINAKAPSRIFCAPCGRRT